MIEAGIAVCGALAALGWIVILLQALPHRRRPLFLADRPDQEPEGGWPELAVVLAARDEAGGIEPAIRSLLQQDYPRLRVVAVDDRSTDGTGAILDRLAGIDGRLRPVRVERLPAGWLGKTHALQVGLHGSRSEWVLFTDGDVRFEPGALRRALRHAIGAGLDHLTVIPDVPVRSPGEKLFLMIFGLLFALRALPWRVERPGSRAFTGAGAFNLVRRSRLEAAGGFERIAFSVDDDLRLGQLLKWTGGRADVLFGADAVWVPWHVGLAGLIRGVEKNFFAGVGFRPWLAAPLPVFVLWLGAAPHVGLLAGPWWSRGICLLGIGGIAALLQRAGEHRRIEPYYALWMPVAAVLLCVAFLRSVGATWRQGGIRWRGRVYPLAELRAHVRRRDAWMRRAWKRREAVAPVRDSTHI